MQVPTRAQARFLMQLALTLVLTPLSLVVIFGGFGQPWVQKLAAGWVGTVIGYWFR